MGKKLAVPQELKQGACPDGACTVKWVGSVTDQTIQKLCVVPVAGSSVNPFAMFAKPAPPFTTSSTCPAHGPLTTRARRVTVITVLPGPDTVVTAVLEIVAVSREASEPLTRQAALLC